MAQCVVLLPLGPGPEVRGAVRKASLRCFRDTPEPSVAGRSEVSRGSGVVTRDVERQRARSAFRLQRAWRASPFRFRRRYLRKLARKLVQCAVSSSVAQLRCLAELKEAKNRLASLFV